ncbi:clostripain-related cysteine peptidase [uncultured Alistipes sp.]|uniref:clostripain-related cysteine peptidase n=1 Tax=uncultured Alistipes sp. TaxID=538949 RepID=UPI0025E67981|nr:clostripain-related cysteine peptidase [uncultured Alistipes sp.]
MKIILQEYCSRNAIKSFCFIVLMAMIAAMTFPSCSDDDNGGGSKGAKADYTIMLYGTGGGNLDESLMLNLEEAGLIGSGDKVKMTAQIKLSKRFQDNPEYAEYHGTRRFIVGSDEWEQEEELDVSLPFYEPSNIADFINWSKTKCPASKYILILWNHGGGWDPVSDRPLQSRGVVYDDNLGNRGISIYELAEGIKRSNTKFEMIYFDACLMNMLENLGELTDVCNYTLAAGHLTPGMGGEYSILMTLLAQNNNFVDVMKRYCRAVVNHWSHIHYGGDDDDDDDDDDDEDVPDNRADLTLTDMSKLPAVFAIIKEVADELVASYEDYGADYDGVKMENCYIFEDSCPFVEVEGYIEELAVESENVRLIALGSRFALAVDEAIVCQAKTEEVGAQDLAWSVTLVNKTLWDLSYAPYSSSYSNLKFEKQTGWSRWLKLNNTTLILDVPEPGHEH